VFLQAAIFIIFWQSLFLSILFYFDVLKETEYFSAEDVQVGIEALLLTAEMCVFAFLHIKVRPTVSWTHCRCSHTFDRPSRTLSTALPIGSARPRSAQHCST